MVNYKYKIAPILCVLLLLLLVVSECRRRDDRKISKANMRAAFDSVTYYKNKLGTQAASVKTFQFDKKSMHNELIKKDTELNALAKEFASVKSVVKLRTVTKLDTIYAPFTKAIQCEFKQKDSVSKPFYSFGYSIDSTGLEIKDFIIPNETTIITGFKRKWLLGNQTLTTDVTHSNPHIKTENILSAEVIIPEPWYAKWYVWLVTGLVTGILVK